MSDYTDYEQTGRRLYEKVELEESGMTLEECTFRLMYIKSFENLCDQADDNECDSDGVYYTDDQWGMTHYCKKHLEQQIADGAFVEVK